MLVEPRSLFDDALHASDELKERAKGSGIQAKSLFKDASELDFGTGQRATYLSIMRVGAAFDDELPVKRVDVAGDPDKLFGRLRQLVDADFTVVFSSPHYRARMDMETAFVDHGLPIVERLDVLGSPSQPSEEGAELPEDSATHRARLKRGVVNVVDVEIPLGMIIPKAKLAMISVTDTQGAAVHRPLRTVDITQITFPYVPGDYVVHAKIGRASCRERV